MEIKMKEYIEKISNNKNLTYQEAYDANNSILDNKFTDIQIGAFWAFIHLKKEEIDEIYGFLDSLKEHTYFIDSDELKPVDLAIGYDGKKQTQRVLNFLRFPLYLNLYYTPLH
jgi:anthranilate phosphoribosyltransferase